MDSVEELERKLRAATWEYIDAFQRVALAAAVEETLREATRGRDFSIASLPAWLAVMAIDSQALVHAQRLCTGQWLTRHQKDIIPACKRARTQARRAERERRGTRQTRDLLAAYDRLFPDAKGTLRPHDVESLAGTLGSTALTQLRSARAHADPAPLKHGNASLLGAPVAQEAIRRAQEVMDDLMLVGLNTPRAWVGGGLSWDMTRFSWPIVDALLLGTEPAITEDRAKKYDFLHEQFDAGRWAPNFNDGALFLR